MNREYLRLRTQGRRERIALYRALFRAGWARLTRDPAYRSPGQFLQRSIMVRANGCWMKVRAKTDDLFYVLPSHKPSVVRWFRPSGDDVVVDVGAHIGYFTLQAARRGARVVALEGNPKTFEILSTNIRCNELAAVTAIQSVLGAGGPCVMAVVQGQYGMSSTRPDWIPPLDQMPSPAVERTPVLTERLDSVLEGLPLERIDWMLLDVEGSEADVLKGAKRTLERAERVLVEVFDSPDAELVESLLRESGLEVVERERQTAHTAYWFARRKGFTG
jgi:FkbM family methyltransferase